MEEKRKIRFHRWSWGIILLTIILAAIFIPIIVKAVQPELEMVDDVGYINNYYETLDETSFTIEITFNRKVKSGYATVKYYDSSNNLIATKRSRFYAYDEQTAEGSYITVDGKVDRYKIISFEFEPADIFSGDYFAIYLVVLFFGGTFAIAFFISSLLLCYKEYSYNGNIISVYAGWFHHTLRINGEILDEHTTSISLTPIYLSTTLEDGTKLEATISHLNRISLKANDKLIMR